MTRVRLLLIQGLRWLLARLEPARGPLTKLGVLDPVLARAVALTREQESRWPERSGEAKRHQVYALLLKEFPDTSKRSVSRAIEDAL